ncbi:unnamed protein product [Rotaria socialis]|uniref:O-methyltransferase dimerisation domain-containing protein n=1 Tax=Rotaria socialis TaxID=392032 RepID=A0A817R637_9BILA|nr:unnamed protein product [Rotaria socialis]CAF3314089.1 unnamed protein product [Rotaria socialis]CAF3442297.1 unnamed protein product [Rotaria socialis]CAF3566982.1 unnamed protein product [Rotaria socialis]CAF3721678.1 unnamed protein product [Rotaria socialis]
MTSPLSIYDSEQYLFEIAQNFIRSRVVFTASDLKIFDLLLSCNDGLSCSDIAKNLNLHYVENQSRCLQDVLDCLTSMNLLERCNGNLCYKLTNFARNFLLPNREVLLNIDENFYKIMPKFDSMFLKNSSKESIHAIMLLRIKQLVDLTNYSNISFDTINKNSDMIVLWRQDGLLKDKIKQAYHALPTHGKGVLILIFPDDEVTLAFNLFNNMMTKVEEQENPKELYSKKFLRQIGFRSVEKKQSENDLQILIAYK